MNYSVSELGKAFGLSRSTLIYYHKMGLLVPSGRSANNYRCYSQRDFCRLEKIMCFRNAGMPLKEIEKLLASKDQSNQVLLLEQQLQQLNKEIKHLRHQQQATIQLLQQKGKTFPSHAINKKQWVALLSSIGLSDEDMWRWHRSFEQSMPDAHQDFLDSLGIDEDEIQQIRTTSQNKHPQEPTNE